MKSLFVNLIPENWLHAIGAALFHSLWIGVVLSVITALLLSVSRKSSSAMRYKLLVGCLLLFVAGVGASFVYELGNEATKSAIPVATQANAQPIVVQQGAAMVPAGNQFDFKIHNLMDLWNAYSAQIVLIWFLIICAKSIHLWVGLSGIAFLKKNQTFDAGKFWEVKVIEIGHKLGMSKAIKLVQSGIAKVPMVVGHFKPVILLPLGLINGLSIAEVEAILAHELAHVKRRDYLVNLLQNLLEIVFFFNPAVLWMSKLIRTEREHCCDDLALQCVGDKKNYVNALLYCQEFQAGAPGYAMALTGGKNQLLDRVKRMLFDTRSSLNKMEKAILAMALVTVFICSAAFTQVHTAMAAGSLNNLGLFQDKPKKQQDTAQNKKNNAKAKAKPTSKTVIKQREVVTENGVVVKDETREVNAADKSRYIADSLSYERHKALYKQNQLQNNAEYKKAQEDAKKQQQYYEREQQRYDRSQKLYDQRARTQSEIERKAADIERKRAEIDKQMADSYRTQNTNRNRNLRLDSARRKLSPLAKPLPTPRTPLTPATPLTPLQGNLDVPAAVNPPATPVAPKTSTKVGRTTESISVTDGGDMSGKEFSDQVNREMLKDGIIKTTNNLSYRLDGTSFVVNGHAIDAETHQKYKAKYLKKPGTALVYNYEVRSK
ncbi:M56 family metallopeptidase [Pedobacter sp. KR3-3]|uniref:M56 family metallopeptidase n=1 Tax=Pedobacter albus TaxID=3113905 RepID=A0ABU7I405_9SPHI|nr:M56 family metallopeptidase [Pedobacter sp. KR3-3]MEE1943989.1 M56 family metallopeptidase [Pedobacter sp. KR3-3]